MCLGSYGAREPSAGTTATVGYNAEGHVTTVSMEVPGHQIWSPGNTPGPKVAGGFGTAIGNTGSGAADTEVKRGGVSRNTPDRDRADLSMTRGTGGHSTDRKVIDRPKPRRTGITPPYKQRAEHETFNTAKTDRERVIANRENHQRSLNGRTASGNSATDKSNVDNIDIMYTGSDRQGNDTVVPREIIEYLRRRLGRLHYRVRLKPKMRSNSGQNISEGGDNSGHDETPFTSGKVCAFINALKYCFTWYTGIRVSSP